MGGVGEPPAGNLPQHVLSALPREESLAREDHPHVPRGVLKEVGRVGVQVDDDVLEGLPGVRGLRGPAEDVVGDRVVVAREPGGDGVEVVLRAVDAVGDAQSAPVTGGLDPFGQRLDEDDVVVHRVDALFRVGREIEEAGEVAVAQLNHDGERALAVQRRPRRDDCRVLRGAVQRLDPGDAQRGLKGKAVGLLHLGHRYAQRAHLVLAYVVEAEVERQASRWRLEHELREAGFPHPRNQVVRQADVFEPARRGHFENVGRVRALRVRHRKRQLAPQVRQLHVQCAHQELAGVEGPPRDVADAAVGLHDRFARFEARCDAACQVREYLGEQRLALPAEGDPVPVPEEPFDEILREVRAAGDAQLAVEGESPGVEPEHDLRARAVGRLALRVGASRLFVDLLRFLADALPLVGGKVLKHAHLLYQPFVGRVAEETPRPVALSRDRHEFAEGLGELPGWQEGPRVSHYSVSLTLSPQLLFVARIHVVAVR